MSRTEYAAGDEGSVLALDSGLDALRSSPSFRGPVESLDGHESNDHMALIYESRDEQVAATVPYLVQGLRRGEQCTCLLEDDSKAAVLEEMRRTDVDVDEALESGAISFHTVEETYLRNGSFDGDEMVSFYQDVIDEATREYGALRIAATVSWLLDESISVADFMAYESKVNDLFRDEDCIALCQYDRTQFPAEILETVIQTHPHLVYDNTVCHNFYYTPPEEFFGPDQPEREVDRMIRTLVERTDAKVQLEERERYLHRQNEITADPGRTFEEKLQSLLDLGRERFDLDVGFLSRIDGEAFEIVQAVGDHATIQPESTAPVSETCCRDVVLEDGPLDVEHASEEGWTGKESYERDGLESFLGTTVTIGNEPYGTLCFADTEPRDREFSDDERTFLELTSQWISYEIEREHREVQLAALNEMARDLMTGETKASIAESAVEHAASTLRLPTTAIVSFDHDTGGLTSQVQTDAAAEDLPTAALCDRDSGPFWETFVANEVRTVDDVGDLPGASDDLTQAIAVPLGTQGLFVTATNHSGGFCPAERDFVEATAATVETATVRADRERKLQERERTLESQNETLERLDRVNDIIRSIDQALVQASTRAEIEAVVCEQLATAGPYELAWIGDHDAAGGEITPRESAGAEKGFLDGLAIDTAGDGGSARPPATALETRERQVANDLLSTETSASWRQAALNRGYHATVALPLIYQDRCYGVLTIYAGQPDVFDELERSVLAELSETIANAISAVESKKALVSEETTVLEFTVGDESLPLVTVANETDAALSVDTVVPRSDGQLRGYFTTRGVDAADVVELEPTLPLTDLERIAERDADGERIRHFEATLHDGSLAGTVLDHGARLRDATASDGTATVKVEVAADTDVREFVEMFRTRYADVTLVAQRSARRDYRTAAEFYAAITEELTPRQLEAIQTAYFSGFFDRPRPRTGGEIAEAMDISQPTFNAHLRTAQRKLCQRLFEADGV